jgi:hypothetical protein
VVSALDPTGHDAIAVRVFVDGQLVADGLDGKAMLIDPGVHTLRYELAGSAPVEETVLIREAQKDRTLRVQFQSGPAKPGPLAPAVAPIAAQAPPLEAPVPPSMPTATHPPPAPASIVVPLTLAGVGLVGLGAFAVLAGSGQVQYSHCNRTPAPCTSSDINALEIKRDVAWGAGAVGLLSLGTATWLFLARRASTASVGVAVRETRGGALAELEGAF